MKARWIDAWGGPLRCGELPDPRPAEGELLIQVEACGVGLTVLNCMRGDLGNDPDGLPLVPGHELVGVVAEAGPGVGREWIGRRVVAYFYLFCGRCQQCSNGEESLCTQLDGYVGVQRNGGYAELATIPLRNAVPVSTALDPVLATAIPDAIATPVRVAQRAALAPGERVAVIGAAGGVGVHMVQVALLHGARVAALEADRAKLAAIERKFDVPAIDSSEFSDVHLPADWNDSVDVVIDLLGTSGSAAWSAAALDRRGRLVLLTTFRDVEFSLSQRAVVLAETTVLGSRYARRSELRTAAHYVETGRIEPIIGEIAPWTEVDSIHAHLTEGSLWGRGAIDWKQHAAPEASGD